LKQYVGYLHNRNTFHPSQNISLAAIQTNPKLLPSAKVSLLKKAINPFGSIKECDDWEARRLCGKFNL
jgi:hypothetical protein